MNNVFIAGCGYVGTQLAQKLIPETYRVKTMVRSRKNSLRLSQDYDCLNLDLDNPSVVIDLPMPDTTLFYFVPPPSQGLTDYRLKRFLHGINKNQVPNRIVLISTTGIYGDCADQWVDETRQPQAETERAKRRLSAENILRQWCQERYLNYIILRVPGIYGPGKLPLTRILDQKPILNIEQSPWSNRVHIDDLIQSCIKAIDYSGKEKIFNISDGNPSSMSDFFLKVAAAMDLPEPQQISLEECKKQFSDKMMSYLLESKKIDNSKMRYELNVQLKYPLITQGLESIKTDLS